MPVTHDVGAFSWEWRHKSHKKLSMGCLPSRFVAFGTSWRGVKLTNGAARCGTALKGHPLFGLYASAAAEVFRRRGSHPFCWRYMLLKPNALRMYVRNINGHQPASEVSERQRLPFWTRLLATGEPAAARPGIPATRCALCAAPVPPPWLRSRV
jgi:hypothetical protein